MNKILILGCSGFIGKNIALSLLNNVQNKITGTYHTRIPNELKKKN